MGPQYISSKTEVMNKHCIFYKDATFMQMILSSMTKQN